MMNGGHIGIHGVQGLGFPNVMGTFKGRYRVYIGVM